MLDFSALLNSRFSEIGESVSTKSEDGVEPVKSGWGSCKSCDCKGYVRGARENICRCQHHFSQHR
jgi:hypothetical protein